MKKKLLWLIGLLFCTQSLMASQYFVSHRNFFKPKYSKSFNHFSYVHPTAPKGGQMTLAARGSTFDTLNPYILKGIPPEGIDLLHATLMKVPLDDPNVAYPYLADSLHIASDHSYVIFRLRKDATFHDGSAITSKDVVYTFELLRKYGAPQYALALEGIATVSRIDKRSVKFSFKKPSTLLPFLIARMPVLSKDFYRSYPFQESTLLPPVGSGPYEVEAFKPGDFIRYKRVREWWGRAIPANRGQYNLDSLTYRYFKAKDTVVEALARNLVDYNWEWSIARWLHRYNFPAVQEGTVVKKEFKKSHPHGLNALFLNTRKAHLKDRRVRKALNLLFNFEWLNHQVFFDRYQRNKSIYMNTGFGAKGRPSKEEVAVLKSYEKSLYPPEARVLAFNPPENSPGGVLRIHFEEALALFQSAGWHIQNGVLQHPKLGVFKLNFLFSHPSYEKQYQEYFSTLRRFGIQIHAQAVDSTTFMARLKVFDYDAVVYFMPSFYVPGREQTNMWNSRSARIKGSLNLSGIQNPMVDDLIQKLLKAPTLSKLQLHASLLDRVLSWGYYMIPMWAPHKVHVAYVDKFGFPPRSENMLSPHAWWIKPSCSR